MEVTQSIREFKYAGVVLKDPGAQYTLEKVREFYATIYPELLNAAIEGPTIAGAKTVYEFRKAVGTKGGAEVVARVDALLERRRERAQAFGVPRHSRHLHAAVASAARAFGRIERHGEVPAAIMPPSGAVPLLP